MTEPTPEAVSIHDFTIIVDTEKTISTQVPTGDKIVCRVERPGEKPLPPMECTAAQLLWVIEDPDYFTAWYAQAVARRDAPAAAAPEPAAAG